MARQSRPEQALQHLPKKWAVTIIVALILYALLQPLANSRLGWKLPSLAGLAGSETPADPATKTTGNSGSANSDSENQAKQSSAKDSKAASSVKPSEAGGETSPEDKPLQDADDEQGGATSTQAAPQKSSSGTKSATPTAQQGTATKPASSSTTANEAAPVVNDPNLKYGVLKDIGRETYVSPAGLQYTRGSEEGHRLKHLERHLKDIPDRPGKHGVFDGDMAQVLRWIDDAYSRGERGAKGVTKRTEDRRTIYEAPFTKPIGYVGGRDGKRANHPDAKRIRLVVEGNKVITAFPF